MTRKTKATTMEKVAEVATFLDRASASGELEKFLSELLTPNELHDISLRLRLLHMLNEGMSQRGIAKVLHISLCKITRGSRILKDPDSVVAKLLNNP